MLANIKVRYAMHLLHSLIISSMKYCSVYQKNGVRPWASTLGDVTYTSKSDFHCILRFHRWQRRTAAFRVASVVRRASGTLHKLFQNFYTHLSMMRAYLLGE